jgi:hypothetical protein
VLEPPLTRHQSEDRERRQLLNAINASEARQSNAPQSEKKGNKLWLSLSCSFSFINAEKWHLGCCAKGKACGESPHASFLAHGVVLERCRLLALASPKRARLGINVSKSENWTLRTKREEAAWEKEHQAWQAPSVESREHQ